MEQAEEKIVSALRKEVARLKDSIAKSRSKQVQASRIKDETKKLVSVYFRSERQHLLSGGLDSQSLVGLDNRMQELLQLTQKNAMRSRYLETLNLMGKELNGVEVAALVNPSGSRIEFGLDQKEKQIGDILHSLVPTAGLSYEQACIDLRDRGRKSYRGAAAELRESLREVLEHLAPDSEVANQPSFTYESGRNKPTMQQRVRFIFKSRGRSKSLSEAPEAAVRTVEEKVGVLARSVYRRSSLSTHVGTTQQEGLQIKAYVDVVLCDLFEIAG